jgi:DNA-binding transcriptional regulator LsrR (DeoR family)
LCANSNTHPETYLPSDDYMLGDGARKRLIEAILIAYNEGMDIETISEMSSLSEQTVRRMLRKIIRKAR